MVYGCNIRQFGVSRAADTAHGANFVCPLSKIRRFFCFYFIQKYQFSVNEAAAKYAARLK